MHHFRFDILLISFSGIVLIVNLCIHDEMPPSKKDGQKTNFVEMVQNVHLTDQM